MRQDSSHCSFILPAHLPLLGIHGIEASDILGVIRPLVQTLARRGIKLAIVVNDDLKESPLRENEILGINEDLVTAKGDGIELFYHEQKEQKLFSFLHRHILFYDLILIVGLDLLPLSKVWLLSESGVQAPSEMKNIVKVIPAEGREEKLRAFVDSWNMKTWCKTPLWGCVLIGGKSSRMGTPKHLIKDERGVTWLERTVEVLQGVTEDIVLSGQGEVPESLQHLTRLPDIPDVAGPMTGILAATRWQPTHSWLLLACDMPCVQNDALEWLLDQRTPGRWATVPRQRKGGFTEPLFAHYDFRCAPLWESLVHEGVWKIGRIAKHEKVHSPVIPEALVGSWRNVNTPCELKKIH